jgi:hypothetical protein
MRLLASVLLLALAGTCGCGSSVHWTGEAKISDGQEKCMELSTPAAWKVPAKYNGWIFGVDLSSYGYALRRSKDNQALYIRMYFPSFGLASAGRPNFYSENEFAFEA